MTRPPFTGPELCAKTAAEVVDLLRRREVSPDELLDAAYARIANVEPKVNALPTLCEDRAREHAARLKDADPQEHPGWLAGLPFAVKDLTVVRGVRTTYATPGYADFVPDETDPLIERLERREGIVAAKSNTPEMGAGGNTFNEVFGRTRNPWDVSRNAGGSSGGAAVSLATGEMWLAHGSDLAGSLRTPAAYCGVVGLRPSPGRAGGGGKDLAFLPEGVQGPMARNALDCALFLDAMSGFNSIQPLSLPAPLEPFQKAVREAEAPPRIAYAPDLGGFAPVEPEIREVMARAMKALEKVGTRVEEAAPDTTGLHDSYIALRAMTWAAGAGKLPEKVQSRFKRTLRENIQLGRDQPADAVYEAHRTRSRLFLSAHAFLEEHGLLAMPVVGLEPGPNEEEYPPQVDGVPTRDYVDWLRFSFFATTLGLPAISTPIGFTRSGMPVGLQIVGPPRGEAKLLAAAAILEAELGAAGPPIDPQR